jgi:probable phosphoglycerate mutase
MSLPARLWLVRHGESTENIVRHLAEEQGLPDIIFPERQSDVQLSAAGRGQARGAGKWFAALSEASRPTRIYSSTFVRAQQTAELIAETGGIDDLAIPTDERLREREQGIFQRLTVKGAMERYPDECARREQHGKYYYRAPGGESWCDVILRLRSFWRDLRDAEAGERVLIVTHEAVVRCFRCVIEGFTEAEIMAIDRLGDVRNGAITEYQLDGNRLNITLDNYLPK